MQPNSTIIKSDFKLFQKKVKDAGGIWSSDNVYFAQYRDGYSASYKPNYPEHSKEDCAITYSWVKHEWEYITPDMYDAAYKKVVHSYEQEGGR